MGLVHAAPLNKVGHHGSHNATPKTFVEQLMPEAPWAMASTKTRKQWKNIPKKELLEALERKHAELARSDDPPSDPGFHVEPDVIEARIPIA